MKKWVALCFVLLLTMMVSFALADTSACDHDRSKWSIVKTVESTCTKHGERTYHCSCGGYTYVEPMALAEHDWERVKVRESTCTTHGYKKYECKNCDAIKRKELELAPHNYGSWQVTREATCTEKGSRIRYCLNCSAYATGSIAKTPHPFGSWTVVREATDRSVGVEAHVCMACSLRETREFYPKGTLYPDMPDNGAVSILQQYLIDNGYLVSRVDGDYGKKTRIGVENYQRAMGFEVTGIAFPQTLTAIFCVETGKDGDTVMTHNPHVYGDWNILTAATAGAPGLRSHTCLYCDYTCEAAYNPAGTLTPGMEKCDEVKELQKLLIEKKIIKTIADGDYGAKTEKGVRIFQRMAGLEETGIAYPETIEALRNWN